MTNEWRALDLGSPKDVVHTDILEDVYLSYFSVPPEHPTDGLDSDGSPSLGHDDAYPYGEDGSELESDARLTPKPCVTLRMPISSGNMTCAIDRPAASPSGPSSPDSPPLGKTYMWVPMDFEWPLVNSMELGCQSELEIGEKNVCLEAPGPLKPLRPTVSLSKPPHTGVPSVDMYA
jgi:hypothetical protein